MGCDVALVALLIFYPDFNPRTPCGVRIDFVDNHLYVGVFKSKRTLQGATRLPCRPCSCRCISIHAPLAGRDDAIRTLKTVEAEFQSTHPLRGATVADHAAIRIGDISIHAPLAGRDSGDPTHRSAPPYFNPRTPCGVRRGYQDQITAALVFQSTHPLRGATANMHKKSHTYLR